MGSRHAAPRRPARTRRARAASAVVVAALLLWASPTAAPAQGGPLTPLGPDRLMETLDREVYGYLPYWEIDGTIDAYLRYDLLSTLSLFSITYNADGTINTSLAGYRGITGDTAALLIERAHAAGVRVEITVTSFGTSKNAAFFSDPVAQATAIAQTVDLVAARGADGVNVDVELIEGTYFDEYGSFLAALRSALQSRNPYARVTVATNANTSGSKMAKWATDAGADLAFLMGYNYRGASSNPVGSISPLARADGGLSLSRSLDMYAEQGVPPGRIVLGLPYYGRTWPTVSGELNAVRQTDSTLHGSPRVFYVRDLAAAASGAIPGYDPVEHSAWLARWDPAKATWVQTYYDSPTSLAAKYDLARVRGLAGVGIWALGYDRGEPGYWELIAATFGRLETLPPAVTEMTLDPSPTRTLDVTVGLAWRDGTMPAVEARLWNAGQEPGPWVPAVADLGWTLTDEGDGTRTVRAQVRDASGLESATMYRTVRVDTTGPVVSSLRLSWSSASRRWVASYLARDASGVAAYEVRYRVNGGSWRTLAATTSTSRAIAAPSSARLSVAVRARDTLGTWGTRRTIIR